MNVVLPEKEKIKKRTIAIYSIAAIACVLAIAVVVGIQILGNDTIDSMFKINKIINKTEQEEAQLKANFSNLYDNKFYNNNNVNVTKIDENKDIVYTNYEKIETKNNYEINVVLPYINIKNSKIQKWNEEIANTFEKAKRILENEDITTIYSTKYTANIENNILSVMIYADLKENTSSQRVLIQTYNFNLETNKELTLQDVLKIYGLDSKQVQNKIDDDIKKENKKAQELIDLGYNVFTRDLQDDMYKIENSTEFFVKNKNLYIIYAYGNDSNTSEYDIIVI
ncbi:unknown [Clostridium sp. CAG:575]|nr:unknown [Clostridium sp. CAG:575]